MHAHTHSSAFTSYRPGLEVFSGVWAMSTAQHSAALLTCKLQLQMSVSQETKSRSDWKTNFCLASIQAVVVYNFNMK